MLSTRMKFSNYWLLVLGAIALSGCGQLEGPPPDPTPTPVPSPKPNYFDPKDFVTQGTPLNAASDPTKPTYFVLDQVMSGTTLKLIGVSANGARGTSNIYHLEGLITPEKGQPGYDDVIKTIQNWTIDQHLDVELDTKYPFDNDNQKQVQVYFMHKPENSRWLLNRMLVRCGYAVCDLNQASIANVEGWLNDEQFARQNVPPLGLWGTGVFVKIAQRQPPPTPTPIGGANAASAPAANPAGAAGGIMPGGNTPPTSPNPSGPGSTGPVPAAAPK